MNTDKTIRDKFTDNNPNPIWYYKELKSVDVDYVIFYLLKETFVVEIDGSKHEITFGKNRKGEIGQCIKYDDIGSSWLCSFEVINKGFRTGKWFTITDTDTSDEFKSDYNERKSKYEIESGKELYKSMLRNAIAHAKDMSEEQRSKFTQEIEESSYDKLENLVKTIMENLEKRGGNV